MNHSPACLRFSRRHTTLKPPLHSHQSYPSDNLDLLNTLPHLLPRSTHPATYHLPAPTHEAHQLAQRRRRTCGPACFVMLSSGSLHRPLLVLSSHESLIIFTAHHMCAQMREEGRRERRSLEKVAAHHLHDAAGTKWFDIGCSDAVEVRPGQGKTHNPSPLPAHVPA